MSSYAFTASKNSSFFSQVLSLIIIEAIAEDSKLIYKLEITMWHFNIKSNFFFYKNYITIPHNLIEK